MQKTQVQHLGWEDPLEEDLAIHFNILAWRLLWTEEPAGYSLWGHKRVGPNLVTKKQQYNNKLVLSR